MCNIITEKFREQNLIEHDQSVLGPVTNQFLRETITQIHAVSTPPEMRAESQDIIFTNFGLFCDSPRLDLIFRTSPSPSGVKVKMGT